MNQKTVLITGASSGIGRATALELDRIGFRVLAGVRKAADGELLKKDASERLCPVILDVTKSEHIDAIYAQLIAEKEGLYALINNAGLALFTPIEALSTEQLKHIFDVNFFGPFSLTQKLIPLLRESQGRIVNVGSVGAHTTIPFGFTICSSKHALESFTSGLRMELAPWNIDVISVDPSSIATPAASRMVDQVKHTIQQTFSDENTKHYKAEMLQMATSMHKQEMDGMSPAGVAAVIAHALTAKRPKIRYPIGPHARMIVCLSGLLPDWLFDRLKLKLVGIQPKR